MNPRQISWRKRVLVSGSSLVTEQRSVERGVPLEGISVQCKLGHATQTRSPSSRRCLCGFWGEANGAVTTTRATSTRGSSEAVCDSRNLTKEPSVTAGRGVPMAIPLQGFSTRTRAVRSGGSSDASIDPPRHRNRAIAVAQSADRDALVRRNGNDDFGVQSYWTGHWKWLSFEGTCAVFEARTVVLHPRRWPTSDPLTPPNPSLPSPQRKSRATWHLPLPTLEPARPGAPCACDQARRQSDRTRLLASN